MVFFVVLALAMLIILLLLFQLNKTRHRRLTLLTIGMVMLGIFLLGYSFIYLVNGPASGSGNHFFYISFGPKVLESCAWIVLLISLPLSLFCLVSKNNDIDEDLNY